MADLIDRQALRLMTVEECAGHTIDYAKGWKACIEWIRALPSAQPEIIHCWDCARNADNGGLYPDGRTRCPIQEHYALLKDGHCHLAERRTDERMDV